MHSTFIFLTVAVTLMGAAPFSPLVTIIYRRHGRDNYKVIAWLDSFTSHPPFVRVTNIHFYSLILFHMCHDRDHYKVVAWLGSFYKEAPYTSG
jgi:hypothetical protein